MRRPSRGDRIRGPVPQDEERFVGGLEFAQSGAIVQRTEKNTREWWAEINRLADLLKQWDADRENQALGKQVQESMERLGFVVPAGKV